MLASMGASTCAQRHPEQGGRDSAAPPCVHSSCSHAAEGAPTSVPESSYFNLSLDDPFAFRSRCLRLCGCLSSVHICLNLHALAPAPHLPLTLCSFDPLCVTISPCLQPLTAYLSSSPYPVFVENPCASHTAAHVLLAKVFCSATCCCAPPHSMPILLAFSWSCSPASYTLPLLCHPFLPTRS